MSLLASRCRRRLRAIGLLILRRRFGAHFLRGILWSSKKGLLRMTRARKLEVLMFSHVRVS